MPIDLKAVQKALETFAKVAENLVPIFQKLPKYLLEFAQKVSKNN